jgi:UDP-N-acetylmuramyl pentapeptide phosphotransferase/UDP-N-acetylglucosamine-1-phosphate transferase
MPWSDPAWSAPVLAGWLLLYLAIGAAGTWLARRYALGRRMLDQPGERRSHHLATPRGGGIAITAALLLAALWQAWRMQVAAEPGAMPVASFALGLLLVAGSGWLDDHRPVSPWKRLAVHVLASGQFALALWFAGAGSAAVMVAFLAPLVLTNVWNFMDGIDGLATSQAMLAAVAIALWATGAWWWLAWALLAASAGFLPWNLPRARIFLGDVGSGTLGFALGALLAATLAGTREAGAWLLLLPLSAFLVDAGLTLGRRVLRGERWWTPHLEHAYQRLARRLGRHGPVTAVYASWTACPVVVIMSSRDFSFTSISIWLLAWYASGAALWLLIQRTRIPSREAENRE